MNMQMGTKLTLHNTENGLSLDLSDAEDENKEEGWGEFELVANHVDPVSPEEGNLVKAIAAEALISASDDVRKARGFEPDYLLYENKVFMVIVRLLEYKDPRADKIWLSIKRHDRTSDVGWRDLQAIKNRLCGTDCVGLEVYPEHRKVVDTCNQYHLWVHRPNVEIDFGYHERLVCMDDEDVQFQAETLREKGIELDSMPPQDTYFGYHFDSGLNKVGPAWEYYYSTMGRRYHGTHNSNPE